MLDVLVSMQETEPECYTGHIITGMMQEISLDLRCIQTEKLLMILASEVHFLLLIK